MNYPSFDSFNKGAPSNTKGMILLIMNFIDSQINNNLKIKDLCEEEKNKIYKLVENLMEV